MSASFLFVVVALLLCTLALPCGGKSPAPTSLTTYHLWLVTGHKSGTVASFAWRALIEDTLNAVLLKKYAAKRRFAVALRHISQLRHMLFNTPARTRATCYNENTFDLQSISVYLLEVHQRKIIEIC